METQLSFAMSGQLRSRSVRVLLLHNPVRPLPYGVFFIVWDLYLLIDSTLIAPEAGIKEPAPFDTDAIQDAPFPWG